MTDINKISRFGDGQPSVNLMPAPRKQAKDRRRRIRAWVVILGVYLIVLLGGHVVIKRFFDPDNSALAQKVRTEAARMSRLNSKVMSLQGELVRTNRKLLAARSVGKQPNWGILLWLMARKSGREIVLNQCSLKKQKVEDVAHDEDSDSRKYNTSSGSGDDFRYNVLVGGVANSHEGISEFILQLEDTGLFKQVRLHGTNRREFMETEAVAFKIECLFK